MIYDEFPDVKIFFSGTSSLELKENILPFMVGRAFIFELFSFDFEEFLMAKDEGLARIFREKNESFKKAMDGDEPQPPSIQQEFLSLLKEYLIFGGYPEVIKTDSREIKELILKNIYSLYIEKDVTAHFGIKETAKFEDLLRMLAFRNASMLSIWSI
ncbi:MAG TPA: ATP-binding protein [Thermoplasmata archaeon]|nr:ATP-binding protein [Thermoplasmata archaeon]